MSELIHRVGTFLKKSSEFILRCIYPKYCPVCGEIMPLTAKYCRCSVGRPRYLSQEVCLHCGCEHDFCSCGRKNSVYLPYIAGVFEYRGNVKFEICDFKFNSRKAYAEPFSLEMVFRVLRVYEGVEFDFVTFTPMSKRSQNVRGFNQSEVLARGVGEKLDVPVKGLLEKVSETQAQHDLSAAQRRINLKDAIAVKTDVDINNKIILLCDDVKTTGSTLYECVSVLKNAGAKEVYCITYAVTYLKNNTNKSPLFRK